MKVLLLGGTEETKEALLLAQKLGLEVILSTLTNWNLNLPLPVKRITGPLNKHSLRKLIFREHIEVIVDITHPFACEISKLAYLVSQELSLPLFSYIRPYLDYAQLTSIKVNDHKQAINKILEYKENTLLTIGIKNLSCYLDLVKNDFLNFWVKVLPQSKEKALSLGFLENKLLSLPASLKEEEWIDIFQKHKIKIVVSKEVGKTYSFSQKLKACQQKNISLILIKRPPKKVGRPFSSLLSLMQSIRYLA